MSSENERASSGDEQKSSGSDQISSRSEHTRTGRLGRILRGVSRVLTYGRPYRRRSVEYRIHPRSERDE